MGAPKGNKYWQFRDKHGRDYQYTPDNLWNEAIEYFEWIEQNPLWESVVIARGITIDKGTEKEQTVYSTTMPKMRAMTIAGFCLFADITEKTFSNYRKNEDFIQVITRIEQIIYEQKFSGAAAQLLNPNIIARDLGLRDDQKVDSDINITVKREKKPPIDER